MISLPFVRLKESSLAEPISMLRLRKKTEILQGAGIVTVGDLVERTHEDSLTRIPSVGRSTVEDVKRCLNRLGESLDEQGSVDWQKYAVVSGLELVPENEVTTGPEFLAAIPAVINAILRTHVDAIDRLILTERLLKVRDQQMTLDEIGGAVPKPVTRERVRQRQRHLLRGLSDALLYDEHGRLQFYFRKSFTNMWKKAAEQFGDRSEIGFNEFLEVLQNAWGLSAEDLLPHLPLITSVLTSSAVVPQQLRPCAGIHSRLFGTVHPDVMQEPVKSLPTGKAADEIAELGVMTIGDLINCARAGQLPAAPTVAGKQIRTVLNALATGLEADGKLNWRSYSDALGLETLPIANANTDEDFLKNVCSDLEIIVARNATSMRAAEIFQMRTSQPQHERRTLQEVATLLRSHGPSVKREESVLLDELHRQLVERDFTNARLHYRPAFLDRWAKAAAVFEQNCSSYINFCAALAREWGTPLNLVIQRADPIWAVLARYPNGRRTPVPNVRRQRTCKEPLWTGGTIILRGFRRAH